MHTTLKFLIFAFAMLTACDGSDGNSGFDTFDEYMASRESALALGAAAILDIQVVGPARTEHRVINGTAVDFTVHVGRVARRLANGNIREPIPDQVQITIHSRTVEANTGNVHTASFDGARYHAAFQDGGRLLAVVRPSSFYQGGWMPVATFRVDARTGVLAEPALGFPAGTSIAAVVDRATFRNPNVLMGYDGRADASASD